MNNNYCIVLLTCLFIGIIMVKPVFGIKCWYCNSMLDPYCSDPFDNSTANPKDCAVAEELAHLPGVPATMCRKIKMKFNGMWRFKRDCARLGEPGLMGDERYCIYRSGTYNIHMEYCTCNNKDGCNTAPQSKKLNTTLLSLASLLMFGVIRWYI